MGLAYELAVALTMDTSKFKKSLSESGADTKKLANGITSTTKKINKALAAGAAAVAAGTVALVAKSVSAYADYEQTWGGVQKLYGNAGKSLEEYAESVGKSTDAVKSEYERNEKAQAKMLENAQNAYKTSGMSAQEYMENATSFSASLINSLGGDTSKAADMTDVAMRAISDNFNTFGGDMDNITNAFQGFAKQNYTMLDNLKLGRRCQIA